MQTTDILKIDCSVTAKIDATLSILEIRRGVNGLYWTKTANQ